MLSAWQTDLTKCRLPLPNVALPLVNPTQHTGNQRRVPRRGLCPGSRICQCGSRHSPSVLCIHKQYMNNILKTMLTDVPRHQRVPFASQLGSSEWFANLILFPFRVASTTCSAPPGQHRTVRIYADYIEWPLFPRGEANQTKYREHVANEHNDPARIPCERLNKKLSLYLSYTLPRRSASCCDTSCGMCAPSILHAFMMFIMSWSRYRPTSLLPRSTY